jgi:uncharacterized protein YjiS (DUF1127 family)
MTLIQSFPRKADRATRTPIERLAGAVVELAAWMRRRRQMRASRALLETFDDRLLEDIGLRRDQIDPGARRPDLRRYLEAG